MKNRELMSMIEGLHPDDEVCVVIREGANRRLKQVEAMVECDRIAGKLALQVCVEEGK